MILFILSVILFQGVNVCVRVCAWMFPFFFLPKVILICSAGAGVSEAALIGWDLKSPPTKLNEPRSPDQHTQFSVGIDWSNLSGPRGHWTGLPGSDDIKHLCFDQRAPVLVFRLWSSGSNADTRLLFQLPSQQLLQSSEPRRQRCKSGPLKLKPMVFQMSKRSKSRRFDSADHPDVHVLHRPPAGPGLTGISE